jgi:hypothetical protein
MPRYLGPPPKKKKPAPSPEPVRDSPSDPGHGTPPTSGRPAPQPTPAPEPVRDRPQDPGHGTAPISRPQIVAPSSPRGSVSPPVTPAQRQMPVDPAGASIRPALFAAAKMNQMARQNVNDAAAQAQQKADYEKALQDQHAAAQELIRRANPDYDPAAAAEFDQRHGGTNHVYSKDPTTLLLNSVGYTGNGMPDFNAQVERVNRVFNEVYGHPPTPGLVLDLVRAPEAGDPTALRNLFQGNPESTVTAIAGMHQAAPSPEQQSRIGEQKGLEAALRASLYANDAAPLIDATRQILSGRRDRDMLDRYSQGDPAALAQLQSVIPAPTSMVKDWTTMDRLIRKAGFTPNDMADRDWKANQRVLEGATGLSTRSQNGRVYLDAKSAHDALTVIADWQKRMNTKYGLGLKVSGVIDDSWAKAVISLSHTKSYSAQLLAQEASNAGFGGSFDSFKAFTESGQFANNSDGRTARDAIQTYIGAQQGRQNFSKAHPLFQQLGANMPMQFFDKGGWSWGSGVDWILGGSSGSVNPFNNPLDALTNVGGIAEHSIIRGTEVTFDGMNGILQQAKTDVYASEAIGFNPHDWSGSDWKEAAKRLSERDNTWLNILGFSKQYTRSHEGLNFVTNLVGDIIVTKKFGSPGETMNTGRAFAGAMRDSIASSDMSTARALVDRSAYASERVGQAWRYMRQGKLAQATERLDGMQAGDAAATKEWIHDPTSPWGEQFDGYRPIKPGERIEPPAPPKSGGNPAKPAPTDGGTPPEAPPAEKPQVEPVPAVRIKPQPVEVPSQNVAEYGTEQMPAEIAGRRAALYDPEAGLLHVPTTDIGHGNLARIAGIYERLPRMLQPTLTEGNEELGVPARWSVGSTAPEASPMYRTLQEYRNLPIYRGGEEIFPARPEAGTPSTVAEQPAATVGDEIGRPANIDWRSHGGVEGKVGPHGATYKRYALEDGREAFIIRQPDVNVNAATGEDAPRTMVHANETVVVKRPDGFWQVKETYSFAPRAGWGSKAYEDVGRLIQHYGGHGLIRDVQQSLQGKALWKAFAERGLPGLEWDSEGDRFVVPELDPVEEAAGRSAAVGATQAKVSGVPIDIAEEEASQDPKVFSWHDLVSQGKIGRDAHDNIASWNAITRGRILDTWKAPGVPARSTRLLQRVNAYGLRGRVPIYTIHPLAFTRGQAWRFTSSAMDLADKTFESSNVAGTGFLYHLSRTLRTQFTKAANWRELPITGMDPGNVRRIAIDVGMPARKARAYESLFIQARANGDTALLQKVRDELGAAAIKQGREGAATGVQNVFSALVKREAEHLKYRDTPLEQTFGPGGLLESRNWGAISAKQEGMTAAEERIAHRTLRDELRSRGLHPIETEGTYGGTAEKSFFVPGMTQAEAKELGEKYGQESVLTPKGLLYTTGDDAGMFHPIGPKGFQQLGDDTMDNMSVTKLGPKGNPVKWSADIDFENKLEAGKDFMRSQPFGDLGHATQKEFLTGLLQRATDEHERELYTSLLENAKNEPAPLIPEEAMQNFSVPEMALPRQRGLPGMLNQLNRVPQFFGRINRRLVLTTDPVLLEKHGLTDTLRRTIAQTSGPGGWKVFRTPLNRGEFERALAERPEAKALYDSLYDLAKNGDYRYDVEGRGQTTPQVFWTGGASKKWMHAAAGYVDRRLMSGPYQAWKAGGRTGVREWFTDTAEGQKLAEAEGFAGEHSWVLADMLSENLGTIRSADPNFLSEAEQIRNNAKDVRKALAKYMVKHGVNIPVTGHVPAEQWFSLTRSLDEGSQWLVGKYLTANKWNRGGLFRDMSARIYHDLVRAGTPPDDAIPAAIGQAKLVTRYHMLDLADALKVEQTFRWGALFFTKHRLYWNWLMQTMRTRPELAVATADLANKMDQYSTAHPNQTPGTFSFHLPWTIPGTAPVGGKTLFTIPVARLLWLTESQGNPGMLSNLVHSLSSGQSVWPGRGAVEFTTLDSQVNQLALMAELYTGRIKTSDGIMSGLGEMDKVRFQQIYARVQGSYFTAHHRYMDDHAATAAALQHMLITGAWRATAFTGSYPEDQRLTSAQDAVWKRYNQEPNPAEREKLRQKNPWIDAMLGVYNATPRQHILSQQMWSNFTAIRAGHESRLDALLADAKSNPERVAADLFGKKWHAEGDRYQAEITQLEAQAKQAGATSWLAGFKSDHFAQVHKLLAAQLHEMYGLPPKVAAKIAGKGRPAWLEGYRAMLDGPLSPESIAKLPTDQQMIARQTAAVYRQQVRAFDGEPTDKANRIRNAYFDQIYSPWVTERDKWFQRAGREDKQDQGRVYDNMRAWYDAQDKPVTVHGIEFPSPVRAHFAMLPPDAQRQYRQNLMTKQWGWLSKFDKHLLGSDVPEAVQNGWTYYNKTLYEAISGKKGTVHTAGKHPQIDPVQALQYAYYVGGKYPGFYADYVRGLQPVYITLGQKNLGATPSAKLTWKAYLGRVTQLAEWAAGPYKTDPTYLAQRDQLFNKQLWGDLEETGQKGVLNGQPLSRPPDDEYPQGGYLYQLAMAQPDRTFKREFRQWVIQDPDFLYKLFTPGG